MISRTIGAQLFTVREICQDEAGFDSTLSQLKDIGYKTVQVSGIGPMSGATIRSICDKYGMDIICTHKSLDDYENKFDEMIAFHKELNCDTPGLGAMFELCECKTKDELFAQIERLNKIARKFAEHGMTFCYHNHAFEFVKLDGKYVMDYILERGEFDFIIDVYWLAYAAQDPAEFIRKLGKRARVVHFKDLKMKGNSSVISEVMEGNLNWQDIIAACDEAGSLHAMVEQDTCDGNPIDSLRISYNNLKTHGFN